MHEPRTKRKRPAVKPPSSETGTTVRDSAATDERETVPKDEIARRAYEIAHGADAGSDEENWLRAESELHGRSATSG
jgi:hypothetical protein